MIEIVGKYFDAELQTYGNDVSHILIGYVWPLFLVGVVLWVVFHGYSILTGHADESATEFAWRALKVIFIATFIGAAGKYGPWIIDTIDGPDGLAVSVANSFLAGDTQAPTAWALIQRLDDAFTQLSNAISADVPSIGGWITRLDLLASWLLCGLGIVLVEIVAGFVVLLAKTVLAFYFAIGPIFIACLLFRPTTRFFESWVSAVLSAVVLMWISFFLCGMTLHVATDMINSTMDATGALRSTINLFGQAMGFFAVMAILAIVAWQGPHIAAGLTGGSAIQQGHQLASVIYRSLTGRHGSRGSASANQHLGLLNSGHSMGYRAGAAMRSAASSAADAAIPAYQRAANAARDRLRK